MERVALLLIAFFVTMAAAPLAMAQQTPEALVITDDTGDVDTSVQDTDTGDPGGAYKHLDIEEVTILEGREGYTFTASVVDLDDARQQAAQDGGYIDVDFLYNDMEYKVRFGVCQFCINPTNSFFWANLMGRPAGTEDWSYYWNDWNGGALDVDLDEDKFTWAVPRDQILDQDGAPPFPGRQFEDIRAHSAHWMSGNSLTIGGEYAVPIPLRVVDEAPDDGGTVGPLPVVYGIEQQGMVRLTADTPYRASNGEASTFLFEVTAINLADDDDVLDINIPQVPTGWEVTLPFPQIPVAGNSTVDIPIIISTSFAHKHGELDQLVVETHSVSDPNSIGRTKIGIRYMDPPQPAGHHDTVYFHSRASSDPTEAECLFGCFQSPAYMNTLQEDPAATEEPVTANSWGLSWQGGANLPYATYRWELPLDPRLAMGLDFDLDRQAHIVFPIATTEPLLQATLEGMLLVYGPWADTDEEPEFFFNEDQWAVANFTSQPIDLNPNSDHTFELDFDIRPEADLIPFDERNRMVLVVELKGTTAQAFAGPGNPEMEPGGSMQLPLFEYSDPVEEVFDTPEVTLRALGSPERILNPGDLAVFQLDLRDGEGYAGEYDLLVAGIHPEWALFPAGTTVRLDPGGNSTVPLHVAIPGDAFDGDKADLFVQAVHQDDPSIRALARIVVEADTDEEHLDDREKARSYDTRDAPAPGLLLALAGLGAAYRVRRK